MKNKLEGMKLTEIKVIAKEKNIVGRSKMNKAQLIEAICKLIIPQSQKVLDLAKKKHNRKPFYRMNLQFFANEDESIYVKGLNDNQKEAVLTIDGTVRILSVAGSGKTKVLTNRTAYMINEKGIRPSRVMLTSFTNKASEEMRERLSSMLSEFDLDSITLGTFHSIGFKLLREYRKHTEYNKGLVNPSKVILQTWQQIKIAQDIIKNFKYKYSNVREMHDIVDSIKVPMYLKAVSSYKNMNISTTELHKLGDDSNNKKVKLYKEFYVAYEEQKKKQQQIDFDDMLYLTVRLLSENEDVLESCQNKWDYIMVDEAQDNNILQYDIINMISYPKRNLFVVGDDDQCSPQGNKVLTTNGYVDISELDNTKHKLATYDKSHSCVLGIRKGYNFNKANREYEGLLYTVTADNKSTSATDNHKWLVKWNNDAKQPDINIVYMMRQGLKYRIGWCQLFKSDGTLHLSARCRNENAEEAWILKVFNNKTDASIYESYVATKYGLPLVPFSEVENAKHYKQKALDNFFEMTIPFLENRAIKSLNEHDLCIDYPIWKRDVVSNNRHGSTIQEVNSINLIDGLMQVPVHVKGKEVKWETIQVTKEKFKGEVYSLDVEKHHTYISNGIITHNCMYGFRFASPQSFIDFDRDYENVKDIYLPLNYRSNVDILLTANKLIHNNSNRIEKSSTIQ